MIDPGPAIARRLAAVMGVVVLAAGCGGTPPTASPGAPSGPTATAPTASGAVLADRVLLAVAPSSVDGIDVVFDAQTTAELAANPELAGDASAIATGLAIAPGEGGAEDLAIVNVVRLRPGVFSDEWFRDWRDSYDEGACGQAGGQIGKAESELGGRTVHIGSCEGGVLTHHVWLEATDLVVSVTSLGSRRLGERIVAALEE